MPFWKNLFPSVKAQEAQAQEDADEEELVDQKTKLQEKCSQDKHCSSLNEKLQTCNDRVNSRTQTAEICDEELFDYFHCLDHCLVKKNLWAKLK